MELTEEVKTLLLNTGKELKGSACRMFMARTVQAPRVFATQPKIAATTNSYTQLPERPTFPILGSSKVGMQLNGWLVG